MRRLLPLLALVLLLPACVVRREVSAPPAYSQASPYAAYGGPRVADGYCAEAVGAAQDAAARATVTGTGRDAARADRTASYARRDC